MSTNANGTTPAHLREALDALAPSRYNRESWLKVGMAIHDATCGSREGLELWRGWSQTDPEVGRRANDAELEAKWRGFASGGGVTVATLFAMARDDSGGRFKPSAPTRLPSGQPPDDPVGMLAQVRGFDRAAFDAVGAVGQGWEVRLPMRSADGAVLGWRRRRCDGQMFPNGKKALTLKGGKLGPMFPAPLPAGPVLVVEGETDLLACLTAGQPAVVAVPGATPGKACLAHLATLLRGREVVIVRDNDPAGEAAVAPIADALTNAGAMPVRVAAPPDGYKDADELLKASSDRAAALRELVEAAVPWEPPAADAGPAADAQDGEPVITQEDLADAVEQEHGADLRFCAELGRWFHWDAVRWKPDKALFVFDLVRQVARRIAPQRQRSRLLQAATIAGSERLLRCRRGISCTADTFDANPMLLGTPGGTVDLLTGQLREARREDHISMLTAVAPAQEADCPRWQECLATWMLGDVEMIEYVRRVFGYAMTGYTSEQAFWFLFGPGANGKNVAIDTVRDILGDYGADAPASMFVETRGQDHPTGDWFLRSRRLVTSSEIDRGARWAESKLKKLTGDSVTTARAMRADFSTFRNTAKLMIAGNHQPELRSPGKAMRRRLKLLPFLAEIPAKQCDKDLPAKLKAEAPAILRWVLDGCLRWQRDGLRDPRAVQRASTSYFMMEDTFGRWIGDECELIPEAAEAFKSLWASWVRWCQANNEEPGGTKAFSQELGQRGGRSFKSGGARKVRGIAIRSHIPRPPEGRNEPADNTPDDTEGTLGTHPPFSSVHTRAHDAHAQAGAHARTHAHANVGNGGKCPKCPTEPKSDAGPDVAPATSAVAQATDPRQHAAEVPDDPGDPTDRLIADLIPLARHHLPRLERYGPKLGHWDWAKFATQVETTAPHLARTLRDCATPAAVFGEVLDAYRRPAPVAAGAGAAAPPVAHAAGGERP